MFHFTIRQGATLPSMSWQVVDSAGAVPDLSTATAAYFVRWPPSAADERSPDLDVPPEVLPAVVEDNGVVRVDWSAANTATATTWLGLFHVHFPGGRVLKAPAPADVWIRVIVTPDPSTTP